ncbi:hypothetical protein [Pseudonocardia spinosispora]|uniref:hypothetical protein n=1 Tax=Pseudonocardia spinosispora TaxID=103441 RepID=UPI0003FDA671|nr:hypothetical protein [Pseudonocardia spinosispora]
MRRWEKWLPQAAAAILTASGMTATLTATEPAALPSVTVPASHYVVPSGGNDAADAQGYRSGCTDGRAGVPGLRVLFFGTQEKDGRIRPPGTSVSTPAVRVDDDWVVSAAAGWIRGFTQCGQTNAVLALGVNNKSDGGADPAKAGAAWATLVNKVASAAPVTRVTVTGALDGEPSWSKSNWARGWVDAYVGGTRKLLYAANSADGCPQSGPGEACSNGWTLADVHHVSTGAASTVVALPQIYRTDGVQAKQWANISSWGARTGAGPLRVVGAMSQQAACRQQAGCSRTDNSPAQARDQLAQALAAVGTSRPRLVVTDMDWLRDSDPR